MTYPGNPTLSPEIQDRILSTFRQTLSLAEQGDRQEALLGCDFILRLDSVFQPARDLQTLLEEGEGPVEIDEFRTFLDLPGDEPAEAPPQDVAAEAPAAEELAEEDLSLDLGPLDLDLDLDLDEEEATAPPLPPVPPVESAEPAAETPREEMTRLFEERRFKEVRALAERESATVLADPDLQQLALQAGEILEAESYLLGFLDSARQASRDGRTAEAAALLGKARELDPGHPGVAALERELGPTTAAQPGDEATEPAPEPVPEPAGDDSPPEQSPLDGKEPLIAASLDSESEGRITELLKEGQEAFEKGEYQGAIDAWSRIFLIDIDHAEASRRIELARKLKAEVERKIEEAFHEGITHLETGSPEPARTAFEQVLAIQPNHLGAREYLQRIEQGEVTSPAAPPPAEAPADLPEGDLLSEVEDESVAGVAGPDTAPISPEVTGPAGGRAFAAATTGPSSRRRIFAILGGVVLVLVLAGAWLLYSKRSQMFPNTEAQPETSATVEQDPIARAQSLHVDGQTSMAVAQLRRLPPQHPKYAEAQGLIALWEAGTATEPDEPSGPSEEEIARRQILLGAARQALDEGNGLTTAALLRRAALIAPLEGDETELERDLEERLEPIQAELDLFRQGDWEFALRSLWRLFQEEPDNRDIRQLIVDSYFNLGVRDLQRESLADAAAKFSEALDLLPDDEELQRLATFAAAYEDRRSDLLYRIFVKYYPFRSHGT